MPAKQPDRPPPPPVVQRMRLRYARRGRLRFSSHRDFQRALERALRRGRIPMAYSAGFSPHPKISYAGAAPTGAASEAEYFELGLTEVCEPATVMQVLNAALPDGLDIVAALDVGGPGEATWSLADRLTGSVWRFEIADVNAAQVQSAVDEFLARDEVLRTRTTKKGTRHVDVRHAVVRMDVDSGAECAILKVVVRHTTPVARPDDVFAALCESGGLVTTNPPRVTRLIQGVLDPQAGQVHDPFAETSSVD